MRQRSSPVDSGLRALRRALTTFSERRPIGLGDLMSDVAGAIGAELAVAAAFRVEGARVQVEAFHHHRGAALARTLNLWLASQPVRFSSYDPQRPLPREQNLALLRHDQGSQALANPMGDDYYKRQALSGLDQARVLVCERGTLLAWVGGWRSTPFGPLERATLQRLVPALRVRLGFERQLGPALLQAAGLGPLLEEVGAPAFVLNARGRPVWMNAAARAVHDYRPRTVRRRLAAAIRWPRHSRLRVSKLELTGVPLHHLAIGEVLDARPAAGGARPPLNPRQRQILNQLLSGAANKTIAASLQMSPRTVEQHVARLLVLHQVKSRAALAARCWAAGGATSC